MKARTSRTVGFSVVLFGVLAALFVVWAFTRDGERERARGVVVSKSLEGESGPEGTHPVGVLGSGQGRAELERSEPETSGEGQAAAGIRRGLEVRVEGRGFGPLEGATLRVSLAPGTWHLLGETDNDGRRSIPRAELTPRVGHRVVLNVRKRDWAAISIPLSAALEKVTLVLERGAGLDVLAVDRQGLPLESAELTHLVRMGRSDPPTANWEVPASGDGWVRVRDLAPGVHRFRVRALGHLPREFLAHLEVGQVGEQLVRLEPGVDFVVHVVGREGQPIGGASVDAHDASSRPGQHHGRAVTDEAGLARFRDLPSGVGALRFASQHPEYLFGEVVHEPSPGGRATLVLDGGGRLLFAAQDEAGRNVPGDLVLERADPSDLEGGFLASYRLVASTGPDGKGVAGPLPTGDALVAVFRSSPGAVLWRGRLAPFAPAEERALALKVPAMARLSIEVEDELGHPLAGSVTARLEQGSMFEEAHIRATLQQFYSPLGWDGSALLLVQPGSLRLRVLDHLGQPVDQRLIEVSGDRSLTIVVPSGAGLRGRLLDGQGRPLAGWIVSLVRSNGLPFALTDADGRFTFTRMHGRGDLVVEDPMVGPVVLLRDLMPGTEGLVAVHERFGVRGRVVAPDGSGRAAFLSVAPAEGVSTFGPRSYGVLGEGLASAVDGSFAVELPAGRWRVRARAAGLTGEVTVEVVAALAPDLLEVELVGDG